MTKVTYIFHCGYILPVHIPTHRHTINQLIPPQYWFSFAHYTSSPLHVLLSSNLDTDSCQILPQVSCLRQYYTRSGNISDRSSSPRAGPALSHEFTTWTRPHLFLPW